MTRTAATKRAGWLAAICTLLISPTLTAAPLGVAPRAETEPALEDDGNDVAFWLHPTDAARSLVLASSGTAGLELYGLDGRRVGRRVEEEIDYVDVLYGVGTASTSGALVVGYDRRSGTLRSYTIDADTFAITPVTGKPFETHGEVTGLCGYRSPLTGRHYVFAAVEGSLQQWSLYAQAGKVDGRLVRTIPLGMGAGYCAVDSRTATVYASEESVGIWAIAAEPETDAARTAIDLVAPRGGIAEEVKGLAIYRASSDAAYLLAMDAAEGHINVYSLPYGERAGTVPIAAAGDIDVVEGAEGLAVAPLALGGLDAGAIAVVDEDNGDAAMNIKIVAWRDLAAALGIPLTSAALDPRAPDAPTATTVAAGAETTPVDNWGDAADDPAIWVHPTDPSRSLVIGTNKKQGLDVYDLTGKRVGQYADGRMNNVDLRSGFRLGGREVTLVTASNRTRKSIAVYMIDPDTLELVDVADGELPSGLNDPYGLCMYHDRKRDRFYVSMNDADGGAFRQWRLLAHGDKVRAEHVRDFAVGSETEGCVADDATGALYVGEEDVALWRYLADPKGGTKRTQVDSVEGGHLSADVEGVGLYTRPDGTGYLVVSSQGSDNYAVYRREGNNEFVGMFWIGANDELGIDGASETDGLDVSSAPLGAAFPNGLLVVQDGRNITPTEKQNFKFVSWRTIAEALGLPL
jgi:3-phytase